MSRRWFSIGSTQEITFINEAGQGAARGMPDGPWQDRGEGGITLDGDYVGHFPPRDVLRLDGKDFWNSWRLVLQDAEIDGPSLEIKFVALEGSEAPFGLNSLWLIQVNGESRCALLDARGGGDYFEAFADAHPHLQIVTVINGQTAEGVNKLVSLKSLWGLQLNPMRTVLGIALLDDEGTKIKESESWSELNALKGLRSLRVSGFQQPTDLTCMDQLFALRRLEIDHAVKLNSLKGVGNLQTLESLTVSQATAMVHCKGMESLQHLQELNLEEWDDLKDIRPLERVSGLRRLKISSDSFGDLGPLKGHPSLLSINVSGPRFNAHVMDNTEVLSNIPNIREVEGFGRKVQSEVLFRAAASREDVSGMKKLLPRVLKDHCTQIVEAVEVRRSVIDHLMAMELNEEDWKQVHAGGWTVDEWAEIFRVTGNQQVLIEGEMDKFRDELDEGLLTLSSPYTTFSEQAESEESVIRIGTGRYGIRDALKGYIRSVAQGKQWKRAEEVLRFSLHLFYPDYAKGRKPHPSWEEIVVDLLLATNRLGMQEEHDRVLAKVTDEQKTDFGHELMWYRAHAAIDDGKVGEALDAMQGVREREQPQLMQRILPLVGKEMPPAIVEWFIEFAEEDILKILPEGTPLVEVMNSRYTRELAFFLTASNRANFLEMLSEMQHAFPDDPWVLGLLAEMEGAREDHNQGLMETLGLEMLWQDEAVRAEVGERNLRKLMEARGEEAARVSEQARQAAMDLLRREDLID